MAEGRGGEEDGEGGEGEGSDLCEVEVVERDYGGEG